MDSNAFTRRIFLGATAGTIGAAGSIGTAAVAGGALSMAAAAEPQKANGLRVGMLTAPFGDEPLEKILDFAKEARIPCLEVVAGPGSKQLDPAQFDQAKADAVKKMLADRGLEISALSYYDNILEPEVQQHGVKMVDAAALLGVSVINMNAGFPAKGMSKINTIKKHLPKAFEPVIARAKEKGIKIGLENWFETNLQGIDTFECLFSLIKDENFGLNYDPSHLVHQQLDYMAPISMFHDRIFHTHAKDCLIDKLQVSKVGVYGQGWWTYVIPGFGNINWGEYIGYLRRNDYKGVLSIEHEDGSLGREEGFIHGARYLERFC